MSNVYEKLQEARVKLQNQKIKKSGENNYSGFTYFEIADFIPHVNQIFLELKLCSNFSIKDNIAYLEIINAEKIDEKTVFTMPTTTLELKGCSAIQALGGVNTYCRRYLYLNALEIAENDMLDAKAGNIEEKSKDNPDTDLLLGLEATATTDEALRYYRANSENAKDPKAFKQAYMRQYSKLQRKEIECQTNNS